MKTRDLVVKSNDFIQKARYNLTLQEIKIISMLIAAIDKEDMDFRTHLFDYNTFTKKIGYHTKSIEYIKTVLRKLKSRQYELDYIDDNGDEVWELFGFIDSAKITKDKVVELKFNEDMREYLMQLKNNFTVYELSKILQFESQYTFRIYEILKVKYEQWKQYKKVDNLLIEITVEELKKFLGVEKKYDRYFNFKQKVLEVARKELAEKTDIKLYYVEVKKGKSVVALRMYPEETVELQETREYYEFIDKLREKCTNIEIITDTKRGYVYSIGQSGKLYCMNDTNKKIDKEGAFKLYKWLYENQQYMTKQCRELMGVEDKKINFPEF